MTGFAAAQDRDANRVPIFRQLGAFRTKRTITFAGGTTNAWGDDGGTLDGGAVFTVTGTNRVRCLAKCTADLTGANATIELGITGSTAIFMPTETATQIDNGQIWVNDAANGTSIIIGEEEAAADNLPVYLISSDIILTVATADVTGGTLDFYCFWEPIDDSASIVATTT